MNRCFSTTHLKDNNMSYCQHFGRALRLTGLFFKGGFLTCFHGFVPCCCVTSATDTNIQLSGILFDEAMNESNNE